MKYNGIKLKKWNTTIRQILTNFEDLEQVLTKITKTLKKKY